MLRKTHIRRPVATLLAMLGAALIFIATETWAGTLLLVLGVAVELAGIAIGRRDRQ